MVSNIAEKPFSRLFRGDSGTDHVRLSIDMRCASCGNPVHSDVQRLILKLAEPLTDGWEIGTLFKNGE